MKWIAAGCAALLLAAWLVLLVLSKTLYPTYRLRNSAMEPTAASGDYIVSNGDQFPRRGDIITFRYPLRESVMFCMRVVGMPGDVVQIREKTLYINGEKALDPHAVHEDEQVYPDNAALPEPYRSRDHFGPVKVPAEGFFVMGDNRDRSSDSRYWGFVPRQNVRGKVILVISTKTGFRRL